MYVDKPELCVQNVSLKRKSGAFLHPICWQLRVGGGRLRGRGERERGGGQLIFGHATCNSNKNNNNHCFSFSSIQLLLYRAHTHPHTGHTANTNMQKTSRIKICVTLVFLWLSMLFLLLLLNSFAIYFGSARSLGDLIYELAFSGSLAHTYTHLLFGFSRKTHLILRLWFLVFRLARASATRTHAQKQPFRLNRKKELL